MILIIASVLLSLASYAQQADKNTMAILITQCSRILEYSQQIETLNREMNEADYKIDSLRSSWRQVCLDYLGSSEPKSVEDFKSLIANTDSIFDGIELLNRLVEAQSNLGNVTNNPVISKDVDDKHAKKKDENVKSQQPSNPPVKKKKDEDLDDIKSTIKGKGKN